MIEITSESHVRKLPRGHTNCNIPVKKDRSHHLPEHSRSKRQQHLSSAKHTKQRKDISKKWDSLRHILTDTGVVS